VVCQGVCGGGSWTREGYGRGDEPLVGEELLRIIASPTPLAFLTLVATTAGAQHSSLIQDEALSAIISETSGVLALAHGRDLLSYSGFVPSLGVAAIAAVRALVVTIESFPRKWREERLENTVIEMHEDYSLHPIGHIRSTLRALDEASRQGSEGAPDAWLEVNPNFARALLGIATGDEVVVITWLHRADRDVREVHPRGDPEIPLAGVFATRSPDRPNPLGLHRVTVREISGTRLRIGPIEAIDGTPVVDVKPVLVDCADA